ncbi:hypothetical protein Ahy_A09g046602 [Arachis hypogaea]|uniref:Uncharacterized protein n=1 Tax=Arachis hypogaea TaxID=3818 RepID=A0A445BQC3_ARAHY|nr:hypothetical protein Ahy_A09g046602 [Arachis hypogaea]
MNRRTDAEKERVKQGREIRREEGRRHHASAPCRRVLPSDPSRCCHQRRRRGRRRERLSRHHRAVAVAPWRHRRSRHCRSGKTVAASVSSNGAAARAGGLVPASAYRRHAVGRKTVQSHRAGEIERAAAEMGVQLPQPAAVHVAGAASVRTAAVATSSHLRRFIVSVCGFQAPLSGSDCRYHLRWLSGCRRTGSETTAISVQQLFLRFGKRFDLKALLLLFCYLTLRFVALIAVRLSFNCCMLRLELLRLLRKWLGTEVLVAGILTVDFGSRRKELVRRLGYGICVLR